MNSIINNSVCEDIVYAVMDFTADKVINLLLYFYSKSIKLFDKKNIYLYFILFNCY